MTAPEQGLCRICHQSLKPYPLGERNGYDLIACRFCGSAMVNPWPTAEELDKYFGDVQPEATHIPNHEKYIERLKANIQALFPQGGTGKRFVDISCQNGYSTVAAKSLGFEARGIDNHDFFIRFAKEKYDAALFEEGTAQDLAVTGYKADLIFCLEHLCEEVDIEGFLSAVSRILTPNGILYIEEPDGNHFNVPRRFSGWPVVFPPINFLYPSKSGLEKALRRHGLKIRKSFFTWRPMMRLVVTKA